MDLFSQAERGAIARAVLIARLRRPYLDNVQAAMDKLIEEMPRRAIVEDLAGQPRRDDFGQRFG